MYIITRSLPSHNCTSLTLCPLLIGSQQSQFVGNTSVHFSNRIHTLEVLTVHVPWHTRNGFRQTTHGMVSTKPHTERFPHVTSKLMTQSITKSFHLKLITLGRVHVPWQCAKPHTERFPPHHTRNGFHVSPLS